MKIIGNLKPKSLNFYVSKTERISRLKELALGEIDSNLLEDKGCKQLNQYLNKLGYSIRENNNLWQEPCLVALKGSAPPHTDNKLGLIAFWLIHKEPLFTEEQLKKLSLDIWMAADNPWLITNQQREQLRVGDIVVFNANARHAWLSNCSIYAISQTVSRNYSKSLK